MRAPDETAQHARDQAEAASRTRARFLANMTHELRTPVAGMVGLLRLLLDDPLDDVQRDRAGRAIEAGDRLLDMTTDVLRMSHAEGDGPPASGAVAPRRMLENLALRLGPTLDERALELTVTVDDAVPDTVIGHPTEARRILHAILDNAVKFTGGVVVAARMGAAPSGTVSRRRDREWLEVTVTDNGIGISHDRLADVFVAFHTGDDSATRRSASSPASWAARSASTARRDGAPPSR